MGSIAPAFRRSLAEEVVSLQQSNALSSNVGSRH
jgi:hypothetical protein